jgi:hypothetical protein
VFFFSPCLFDDAAGICAIYGWRWFNWAGHIADLGKMVWVRVGIAPTLGPSVVTGTAPPIWSATLQV